MCLAASDPYALLCEADGVNRAIRVLPRMGAGHRPRIICTLGALLLPIWFGLCLTLRLSSRAFIDSELCSNSTFEDWSDLFMFGIPFEDDLAFGGFLLGGAIACLHHFMWVSILQVAKKFWMQEGSESRGTPKTPVGGARYISVVPGA